MEAKLEEANLTAPKIGDTVMIEPQRKGGLDRKMVFTEEGWQQEVGGNLTKVGSSVQEMANKAFSPTVETPKGEVTETPAQVEEAKVEESLVKNISQLNDLKKIQPNLDEETPVLSDSKKLKQENLPDLEIVESREVYDAIEAEIGGDIGAMDSKIRYIPVQEYDVDENKRSRQIAEQILENEYIEPLIVAYDKKGNPYIVEGQHRAAALKQLGYEKAPVIVIYDKSRLEKAKAEPTVTEPVVEEPKLEGKEAAKAKVDAVAEKLKAALKAKGIEGLDVKKQGIGSDEIIDLAAQGVKAMIDAGYAVKDAIDYVLDSIKDDIEEGELDRVRERVSLKANEDLINQAREAGKSQKSTKGKKEAMERALESKGNDAKKAIFVELNFEAIANELLDSKVITRKC